VLHVAPHTESRLPRILARAGPLPAAHATDGESLPEHNTRVGSTEPAKSAGVGLADAGADTERRRRLCRRRERA
jgi:hypothetical protein